MVLYTNPASLKKTKTKTKHIYSANSCFRVSFAYVMIRAQSVSTVVSRPWRDVMAQCRVIMAIDMFHSLAE